MTGDIDSDSDSFFSLSGNGGEVNLSTVSGDIMTGDIDSSSFSFSASDSSSGNGGGVSLSTVTGDIMTGDIDSFSDSPFSLSGNGGEVSLSTVTGDIMTGDIHSSSFSSDSLSGNGGEVSLSTVTGDIMTGDIDSFSYTSDSSSGNGGEISLSTAIGDIMTGDIDSFSYTSDSSSGNGGEVSLSTVSGDITTGSIASYSSSYSSSGNGGAITLNATGNIIANKGELSLTSNSSSHGDSGNGGIINVFASKDFIIEDGALRLDASSSSVSGQVGSSGKITITSLGTIRLTNTDINATNESPITGQKRIEAPVFITGQEAVFLTNGRFTTSLEPGTIGRGGDVKIESEGSISLTDFTIDTATFGKGDAGDVSLQAGTNISLDNSAIFSITENIGLTDDNGNAGSVTVNAGKTLSLANRSTISTAVGSDRTGEGGDIEVNASSVELQEGSQLQTLTLGEGKAGKITVNATEGVFLTGVAPSLQSSPTGSPFPDTQIIKPDEIRPVNNPNDNIGFSTRIPHVSIASTGNNSLEYYSFEVTEAGTRAIIDVDNHSVSTLDTAIALFDSNGNLLAANDDASESLGGKGSSDPTGISQDPYLTSVLSEPGTYYLVLGKSQKTDSISSIDDLAVIPENEDFRFHLSLDVPRVKITNTTSNNSSGLFAQTEGAGSAGNITLNTPQLILNDGAEILASTSNMGNSSNITVNASQGVILGGDSKLSVETSASGRAGNIKITTQNLNVEQQAQITATATKTATMSEQGGSIDLNASNMNLFGTVGIFAETQGAVPAGTLTLKPNENQTNLDINLSPGAEISASTSGSGQGGSLLISAPVAITISGSGKLAVETSGTGAAGNIAFNAQSLTIQNGTQVSASTSSSGKGGSIRVNVNQLNLNNRAQISAQSQGSGNAGNLNINVQGRFESTNGDIITSTTKSSGGAINLNAQTVLLFGDSDITTNVFSGAGGGGNITITAGSVVAFDDSDILSFARDGKGGDITFNTPAFFGENFVPAPFGTDPTTLQGNGRVDVNASGTINGTITQPDVTPVTNNLSELPENPIDTDALLNNSCIVRTEGQQGNFTVTGSGNLPTAPGNVAASSYPTGEVQALPEENADTSWQPKEPIVEATTTEELAMNRECS